MDITVYFFLSYWIWICISFGKKLDFLHSIISYVISLILKFKTNKKPKSNEVLKLQKFNNPDIKLLNKSNIIESIKLTGNKKDRDTYVLKLNSSKSLDELIELYKKTGLFEYVEPNFVGSGHGFQTIPNDNYFSRQWSHYNDGTFSLSNSTVDADIDTDTNTDA